MARTVALTAALLNLVLCWRGVAAEWVAPNVQIPARQGGPVIACTPQELARLRAAWKGSGPAHDVVAAVVARAESAIGKAVDFPPRGGQHNQWYQCEPCQMGLRTIDETHHVCPRCGTVYSGEPYDDVVFARIHAENLRGANAAAWAYAITGRPMYARHTARVLLGYAERYSNYPLHSNDRRTGEQAARSGGRLSEQTLGEASSLATQIAPAFDLVYGSDELSDINRAAIRDGLIVPMLRTIDRNKAGKSNWQTWHNAAMIWGGAVAGDANWVRKAIADPQNGFGYQMATSVTAEGMWYENSWGYHFYTLQALVQMAEGARRLNADLWAHPALQKMFTLPVRYAMPDGSLPRFGDDVNSTVRNGLGLMECAFAAYQDPAIGVLLPEQPIWETVVLGRDTSKTFPPPRLASEVFPGAGHAILRTEGDAGLAAAMTFGPYGGFHGHYDKLSFVFFGLGQELGVDPGRAASQAYRLPIHSRWYKASIGHNLVLVDGASQKPAEGKLELFAATPTHAAAMARCDEAYPGLKYRRLLCLTPNYLLVVDDVGGEKEHRFDWLYHNRGQSVACDVEMEPGTLGDEYPGQEFLRNIRGGPANGVVRFAFPAGEVTTHLLVAGATGTVVRAANGPGASVMDRVPMAAVTRTGRTARFAAVLAPAALDDEPPVKDVILETKGTDLVVRVTVIGGVDELRLSEAGEIWLSRRDKTLLEARSAR